MHPQNRDLSQQRKTWRVWHVTDGVGRIHALQADVQKLKLNDMLTL
jgi:hypothetical protein